MWKLKGYAVDAFDKTQVVYNIWANTKNDLPSTMTDIGYGTALGFGSTAQTFDDSKEWRWNGNEWVEQTTGQEIEISADDIVYDNTSSGLTATNVQDAIDEIHDTDETQDRALVELSGENANQQLEIDYAINTGSKNLLYISNAPGYTATSHGRTFTVLSDGGIKITGASSDSSNADFYIIGSWGNRSILLNENKDSCLIRMTCDTDYGYNQIRLRVMNRSTGSTVNETGVETNKDVQLSHVITTVFVSVFPSVTLPEDGIVVYPMIRRAAITDDTFEPYAPTNRELYEMILALQSGRSVQSLNSPLTLNANRTELNEQLDSNFDLVDSIPEEEEGELE